MMNDEAEIWEFLRRHLDSIFSRDVATYEATTAENLSLYEWWVTPHRQDGLDFHRFMIENNWSGAGAAWRYDLLEPRVQRYGDCAVATYTFMLSTASESAVRHRTHNETRVLVKQDGAWQVIHVHKSPAGANSGPAH